MNKSDDTLNYGDYLEGTRRILEASQGKKRKYFVVIGKKKFIVYPNVFSPKYFHDTEFFAKNLPVKKGERVLEIGCGTGAIAVITAGKGAEKVVATDVNPDAVKNAKENIRRHNIEDSVDVRQGDLFQPIGKKEKLDMIFWNVPFGLVERRNLSRLEKSVYDPNYQSIKRFIMESKKYLEPKGRIFIGFSSTLGKLNMVQEFAAQAGFTLKTVYETESQETYPVKFEILEMRP